MTIQVTIRNIYGNEVVYPECVKARVFAELLAQKTFTATDIKLIKSLGYIVQVVNERSVL